MTKTILTDEQKKQVVNLLKRGMSAKEISESLEFPMRSVGSIKSHLTMGSYDENRDETIEEITTAQETSLSIERDLQAFLCNELEQIEPGLKIFKNGREFNTGVGRIDILAIDKNGDLLVIELKAGKAKDSALGQLLGYMGFVSSNIAKDKGVRGYIIASDFDDRLKYAVNNLNNVRLKVYKVNFTFENVE
jgi:RecB family endonuclease NucS